MERAIIITVSSKEWNMPKSVLMNYKGNSHNIETMARELFKKYKEKENADIDLLNFRYYGELIIAEQMY